MARVTSAVFLFLFLLQGVLQAQIPVGSWRDHFSFGNIKLLCYEEGKIYCGADNGIFSYNIATGEVDKVTRVNGLSEVGISALSYFPSLQILAIGYESGNIDLLVQNSVVNLPFIKEKPLSGSKTINRFTLFNNLIYTSTDFGLVVVDPAKREIKETYYIGNNGTGIRVSSMEVFGDRFWAATSNGLKSALCSDPLLVSFEHWTTETSFTNPTAECAGVAAKDGYLFALERQENANDILWRFDGSSWVEVDRPLPATLHLSVGNNRILVTSANGIQTYQFPGIRDEFLSPASLFINPQAAISVDADKLAIADKFNGLMFGSSQALRSIYPNGPANNNHLAIDVSSNRVVVASGGYDATFTNLWHPFMVHDFTHEEWSSFADYSYHDAVAVRVNPGNPSDYYVASWGGGLYQFHDGSMVAHFTPENSSLQSIFPNAPYCRISGLDFDPKGNLWVANTMVANPISVRKTDGTWISFPYASAINSDKLSTLSYSNYGTLWLLLPRGQGLFALNPGNNIDIKDDDRYRKLQPASSSGSLFNVDINALAFDRDDYLWLGTSQGVLVCFNPGKVFDGGMYFQKIKIPDVVEGLAVYLLETEEVTSVTVDGGNRKWFGTARSGVFLFSPDGTKELAHYTIQNSPLPSNRITDVKVHPASGEVFIATDKGLVSFRSNANQPGSGFGKVYAFPNPVRPEYEGDITITGLMENTLVKITDISGNLVYETFSVGGMATWNGKNSKGQRASTGVYLVFCSASQGEKTAVTKILFIR